MRDSESGVSPLKFYPISEQLQWNVCARMGLQFHAKNRVRPGGPCVNLTPPDIRTVKHIMADGNLPFQILSIHNNWICIRTAILEHMIDIAHLILDHHIQGYSTIQEYIRHNIMDNEFAWGIYQFVAWLSNRSKAKVCQHIICGTLITSLITKCKKHFIKMLKDVGMVVPKIKETRL